ncbi:hypothetical protein ACHAXS_013554 [Conticribra weissflogii]
MRSPSDSTAESRRTIVLGRVLHRTTGDWRGRLSF